MIRSGLPIDAVLPEIIRAMTAHHSLILTAEPGAGKSTVVPLALLESGITQGKKILMLEPRVLAARAAAKRMAALLGEKPGETVGYRTRLETVTSPATKIEVLTEAILTRMLQNDPALEETAVVIFDEFHERSIHADLSLALTLNARELLRDDLKVMVMSATLDPGPLRKLLGDCPVIDSPGKCYPVQTIYSAEHEQLPLEQRTANAVRSAVQAFPGDALVFLPGEFEIKKTMETLRNNSLPSMEILPLYGSLPAAEQDKVFAPHGEEIRRVILATAIAETSITIPSVRIVIDAGLMRIPVFSPATGMDKLETVRVTKASSDQRRGRAGRTSEGVCIRLWHEYEQNQLTAFVRPEILSCDLASAALELVKWGRDEQTTAELPWLDPPPAVMLAQAFQLLRELDAMEENHLSRHGEAMRHFPLHPRLAHAVLRGAEMGYAARSADLAAVISSRNTAHVPGCDIAYRLKQLSGESLQTAKRIRALLKEKERNITLSSPDGVLTALAYPDRAARRKDTVSGEYTLANGVTAFLRKDDPLLQSAEFLAVAETTTMNGRTVIRLAAPLEIQELERCAPELFAKQTLFRWDPEREAATAEEVRTLGSLTLGRRPVRDLLSDVTGLQTLLLKELRSAGFRVFEESRSTESFRNRVTFLHRCGFPDYPDYSEEALLETLDLWLSPWLDRITSFAGLRKLDLRMILENDLPPGAARRMAELAPEKLEVPSGSHIRIDYSDPAQPAASVKLQELFGMTATPLLAGKVPLLLDILSPAMRTVQKTRDLISFWNESYFLVRKDMRGRYPKHDWPEDPWQAVAHRGVRAKKST